MNKQIYTTCAVALLALLPCCIMAQAITKKLSVTHLPAEKKVVVTAKGKPFTTFIYTDTLEKPVLWPIYAAGGQTITRGFPLKPVPGDPVDHPHHIGLWFNYESVNGLDFWNNSYAIPAEKKEKYGWIKTVAVTEVKSGDKGGLTYKANWTDHRQQLLLEEKTSYEFTAEGGYRIIDRVTTLKAVQDIAFNDIKDGLLGLRVAHELQLPVKQQQQFTDDKGNITRVETTKDATATGNYITSEGAEGDRAWGTRANWCMLYGKKGNDTISIAIIDHPRNPGYPTYWHARGYGLFAANPLGQKIFSEGKQSLNLQLPKGENITFRYRVLIHTGAKKITAKELMHYVDTFIP